VLTYLVTMQDGGMVGMKLAWWWWVGGI